MFIEEYQPEKKKRSEDIKEHKKEKYVITQKEIMEIEKERLEEVRERWLGIIKYVIDCCYKGNKAIIKIIDNTTNKIIVEITASRDKWRSSRLLPIIESTYRVSIKEEYFYVYRGNNEENTRFKSRAFLL